MHTLEALSICRILSVMVLVDDKIFPEEVEAFEQKTCALFKEIYGDMFYSDAFFQDWFKRHHKDLKSNAKLAHMDGDIKDWLSQIGPKHIDKIARAAKEIALADGYYDGREQRFTRQIMG